MYVSEFKMTHGDDLTCFNAQSENADLWHRRLGHVSFSLLNKIVSRDLVRGLPKLKYSNNKVLMYVLKGNKTDLHLNPRNMLVPQGILSY